ncbi:MAG: lipopolysaccharide biosynthesis protein [Acidobacteriota bacterium]|jgi:O-antigen/teichoic acid export membrane protein
MSEVTSNESPKNLTAHGRQGGVALFSKQAVQVAIHFAASIALARLLVPEEFGVASLAAAFSAFPQVFGDLGLGTYLIQARHADRLLFRTLFGLQLTVGVGLAVFQCALGLVAGAFYGDSRVTTVLLVSSLGHPVHALGSLHEKWLRRNLHFRIVALVQGLSAILVAGGCVAMAALGYSYWSLVLPPIFASLIIAPLYWTFSKEAPVPRLLVPRGERLGNLLSFSTFTTGNSLLSYLANNADYLLVGRLLDAEALGFYTFAYTKAFTFSKKVLSTATDVALPLYAAAAGELRRLERGFTKGIAVMFLVNVPFSGLVAAFAPSLVPLVFGAQWGPSILPLQILCVSAAVNAITSPVDSVSYAIGRPDINCKVALCMVPILIVAYWVGATWAGILGVATAVATVKSGASLIKSYWVFRALRWNWLSFGLRAISAIGSAFGAAVVARTVATVATGNESLSAIILGFLLYSILYLATMAIVCPEHIRNGFFLLRNHK